MLSLTVSTEGDGSGRVTSAPPGIDCLSDCDESFGYGTEVTLTATADPGSEFYEWLEGGLSVGSTTDLEIVLTENRTIDAVFDPCELTVSNEQISTSEVFRACETLIVGPSVVVEGTGNAALIGGTMVRIDELSVLTGGSLAVGIGSVEPPGTP